MSWLHTFALVIHLLCALGIIGLVLLQRGKGAEAGAGFGAGASGTVFGARGSGSFLSHMTAILAGIFFLTSLSLAYLGSKPTGQSSVMDRVQTAPATTEPATAVPAPQAAPTEVPPPAQPAESAPK
jgi:preprotein translocase subunit SecG